MRQLREATGMSQSELARRLGVSRQHVNDIEAGRSEPSVKLLRAAERVFTEIVQALPVPPQHQPPDSDAIEPGVAALLADAGLCAALAVTDAEKHALSMIRASGFIATKERAVRLLVTVLRE